MALVVNNSGKDFKLKSALTGKEYILPNGKSVNIEDIDAIFYFGYRIRDGLNDADIERIYLTRCLQAGCQLTKDEWLNITFEVVGISKEPTAPIKSKRASE